MEIEKNKIYYMDCLEGMSYMEDNSVDLVLSDPPYNISRNRIFSRDDAKDITMDFGDWDNVEDKEFFKWFKRVLLEWKRVLKKNGQVIVFGPRKWEYVKILDDVFKLKRELVWKKSNPAPHFMKNSYISSYEKFYWLIQKGEDKKNVTFNFLSQNEMHDVFNSSVCAGKERTEHTTQKPLDVINKIIKIHSDKGELVLDTFLGSGTTVESCILNNREYIGFENDKKSIDIMKRRFGIRGRDMIVTDI